ncbi:MAG: dependent ligase, partial [Bryobacterales bacterium]|nr:dependent ligase [Bryobacterales bacterium]
MSLEEYSRKRHFDKTPEPKPSKISKSHDQRFFIQRHNATRLHYDFRLEIDGTLKSWAVPKGPTLDPAPKRLAAMVEDHPLDYGDFEGNIPAGNYGGGSVMLWDRGTYELIGDLPARDQIARGDLKFRLFGEKLKGEFALVKMHGRGKGNEWLLLKKKDAEARPGWDVEDSARSVKTGRSQEEIAKDLPAKALSAKGEAKSSKPVPKKTARQGSDPMPGFFKPMAAVLAAHPPTGPEWVLEIKWDGVRSLCFIDNGDLQIFTRNGNRCERQYPELAALPRQLAGNQVIVDGEIAVLDAHGVSRFSLIQPRIMNQDAAAIALMARKQPVTLFLFDLLYIDGRDLRNTPLADRKEMLRSILKTDATIRYSEHFPNDEGQVLTAAREQGLEGLMAKCLTSTYQSRRSSDWVKIKLVSQQEFVICGFTKGERDYFGALVLGVYVNKKLTYAGNVGTGFDRKTIVEVYERLKPLVTPRSPFSAKTKIPGDITWVRPELVCEVKFSNWTEDGRLRAPVFLGLRADVSPEDCVREIPVEPGEEPDEEADPKPAPKVKKAPLLSGTAEEARITVDGHELKLTHLNKVLFPSDGYTKRDLLNYYNGVSDLLLPHLKDRPLSLKRYPNGIGEDYFFQKDSPASYPSWLRFEYIDSGHRDPKKAPGPIRYVLVENRAALLFLTNQGCIDQNPWMSRVGSLENPDWVLIDLDPQDCEYDKIVEAALLVRRTLDKLELEGYPKTTGGRGMHIYIPVEPHYTYEETKSFAEVLARIAAAERPDLFTTPRSVEKRQKNKVYFDYLQNGEGKTIAAPYSVRAYAGAPVSTPLEWREVKKGLSPAQFTMKTAPERFDRVGDLFEGVLKKKQTLDRALTNL